MHIKTVKVKNPKNLVIQIPGFIVDKWGLTNEDGVEVYISADEKSIELKPRKGYNKVFAGSTTDSSSKELVGSTN